VVKLGVTDGTKAGSYSRPAINLQD